MFESLSECLTVQNVASPVRQACTFLENLQLWSASPQKRDFRSNRIRTQNASCAEAVHEYTSSEPGDPDDFVFQSGASSTSINCPNPLRGVLQLCAKLCLVAQIPGVERSPIEKSGCKISES